MSSKGRYLILASRGRFIVPIADLSAFMLALTGLAKNRVRPSRKRFPRADKSAMGTVNRPLRSIRALLKALAVGQYKCYNVLDIQKIIKMDELT